MSSLYDLDNADETKRRAQVESIGGSLIINNSYQSFYETRTGDIVKLDREGNIVARWMRSV